MLPAVVAPPANDHWEATWEAHGAVLHPLGPVHRLAGHHAAAGEDEGRGVASGREPVGRVDGHTVEGRDAHVSAHRGHRPAGPGRADGGHDPTHGRPGRIGQVDGGGGGRAGPGGAEGRGRVGPHRGHGHAVGHGRCRGGGRRADDGGDGRRPPPPRRRRRARAAVRPRSGSTGARRAPRARLGAGTVIGHRPLGLGPVRLGQGAVRVAHDGRPTGRHPDPRPPGTGCLRPPPRCPRRRPPPRDRLRRRPNATRVGEAAPAATAVPPRPRSGGPRPPAT